jgi:uncharacterized protein
MVEPVDLAQHRNRTCPICKTVFLPTDPAHRGVFCSKRCQAVDLGRWLNGTYTIPDSDDDAERPQFEDGEEA